MSRCALVALMIALSSGGGPSFAQDTRIDPPLAGPAQPDDALRHLRQDNDALRPEDRAGDERPGMGGARVGPSTDDVDVTVGRGGGFDRAPRDIREPFDE